MELKADEEGTGAADGARNAGGSKQGQTTIDAEEWPNGGGPGKPETTTKWK
jgi:hypothetical protein